MLQQLRKINENYLQKIILVLRLKGVRVWSDHLLFLGLSQYDPEHRFVFKALRMRSGTPISF